MSIVEQKASFLDPSSVRSGMEVNVTNPVVVTH
jgi:hypothetical protein